MFGSKDFKRFIRESATLDAFMLGFVLKLTVSVQADGAL